MIMRDIRSLAADRTPRTTALRVVVSIALASATLLCVPALAAEGGKTRTIKDLEDQEVQVTRDPPVNVQPEQAIEQYRRFLELQSQNERMRAEAMRRLGDLQLEVDEGARAAGGEDFGRLEVKEAIKLYEGLLTSYPDYERNDAVLYQLSRAHETDGQPEKALEVLNTLVAKHPNSHWITESQFRRGEILFSMGRYRDAESAYAAVVSAGSDTGFYEQGLYKHGWSLFKLSQGEESVASFLTLLDRVLIADG